MHCSCFASGAARNFYLLCSECALLQERAGGFRSAKLRELEKKAKNYGAAEFGRSSRPGKKFRVLYKGKNIHFGQTGMRDFTQHHDPQRRQNFKKRMQGVGGGKAYRDKESPLFWSYHLLW